MFLRWSSYSLALLLGFGQLSAQTDGGKDSSSSLENVSSEDLLKLKQELESQKSKLETERILLQDKGLKQSKEFLEKTGTSSTTTALVLLQRAEYVFNVMNDRYSAQAESISVENAKVILEWDRKKDEKKRQLLAEKKDEKEIEDILNQLPSPTLAPDPEAEYTEVINTYQQLMDNFPESQYVVDAMYNIAFFREQEGKQLKARGEEGRASADGDRKQREALKIYQDLAVRFPDSKYAGECYNRIGEYYFLKGGDADLQKAIKNYSKVLDYPQSSRFQEALYKLAWTHYRLGDYPKAISYFTYLVEDVDTAKYYNNETQELDIEALVYIGISFNRWAEQIDQAQGTNEGGYKLIREYIGEAKLKSKRYAPEIMWQLGESYNVEQKDTLALYVYKILLQDFPLFWRAPEAQYRVILTYDRMSRSTNDKVTAKALLDSVIANRFQLYNNYKPASEWSKVTEDKEVVTRGNRMARDVLVDNIIYYYGEAGVTNDLGDWRLAMDYSRQFIRFFPVDTYAYFFHYNLAKIQYIFFKILDSSYEDFVKVSTLYPYDLYRYNSSLNAYTIADSLYRQTPFTRPVKASADTIFPLTKGEVKLIDAINNYARLFADTVSLYPVDSLENPKPVLGIPGKKTPEFLAAAGQIYYMHNDFARASQYFNTIVTRYPGNAKAQLSQRYLMQSYFDRKDYRSSEIIAKSLINAPGSTEDQKNEARTIVFYSIFKRAEEFQAKKLGYKAAREFQRAYEEGTKVGYTKKDQLEIAMYNAGFEYGNAKELKRSVSLFEAFADSFPSSKNAPNALWWVQQRYSEMKDMKLAAKTSERIADKYPNYNENNGTTTAEIALYNAEYYYEQAAKQATTKSDTTEAKGLNTKAIEVSNKFVQRYPKSQYSAEIDFNIAKLYFAVNEEEKAYTKYTQFARTYPLDKRNVQALYDVGQNHLRRNRRGDAIIAFQDAKKKSDELKGQRLDFNKFFSSESVYELSRLRYEDFSKISIKEPNIGAKEDRKLAIIQDLMTYYDAITSYAQLRTYEAAYYRGLVREEFGDVLANREFKQEKDLAKMIKSQSESFYGASVVYKAAVQEYINASEFLDKVYKKFTDDEKAMADSLKRKYPARPDTAQEILKALVEGKTAKEKEYSLARQKELAVQYRDLAKSKISRILFAVANSKKLILDIYVNSPIPADLKIGSLEYVAYQQGVLSKLVQPAATDAIKSFENAIKEMDSLGINDKYRAECQRNLVKFAGIVPGEMSKLAFSVMGYFKGFSDQYRDVVSKGDTYVDKKTGKDFYTIFYEIPGDMNTYISQFAKPIGEQAVKGYATAVVEAKEQKRFDEDAIQVQREMFNYAYDFAKLNYSESDTADKYYKQYEAISFKNQGDDAFAYYGEASQAYSQILTFARENARGILEEAYNAAIDLELAKLVDDPQGRKDENGKPAKVVLTDNPEVRKILALLGKYDSYYAKLLNLKSTTNLYASNYESWKSSNRFNDSWVQNSFNDGVWYTAAAPSSAPVVAHKILEDNKAYPIWLAVGQKFDVPELPKWVEPVIDNTVKTSDSGATNTDIPDTNKTVAPPDSTIKTESFRTRLEQLTLSIVQDTSAKPVYTQDQIKKQLDTSNTVYFRTSFDVVGSAQSGKLYIAIDGNYEFYLNGVFVGTALAEVEDEKGDSLEISELALENFVQGSNVLAIKVVDGSPKARFGLRALLEVVEIEDPTAGIKEPALPSRDELRSILLRRGRIVVKN